MTHVIFFSLLKVRVIEYDASGVTAVEREKHLEFTVRRIVKAPGFDSTRSVAAINTIKNQSFPFISLLCTLLKYQVRLKNRYHIGIQITF